MLKKLKLNASMVGYLPTRKQALCSRWIIKVYSLCVLRKSCLDFSPHATIFVFWPSLSVKALFTALTKLEWIPPHSPRSDDITTTKLLGLAFSASLGVISTFSYKAAKHIHELGWGKIIVSTEAESYFNPWSKSVSKVLAQSKIGNKTFTSEKKNRSPQV